VICQQATKHLIPKVKRIVSSLAFALEIIADHVYEVISNGRRARVREDHRRTNQGRATMGGARIHRGALALVAAAVICALAPVAALAFPERPITLIVPFAPGGANDITARILADPLREALGQPVIIENRAGAGGNIGISAAQRAKPDGYTLLLASTGFVVNPSLYEHVTYDPIKDFAPIAYVAQFPVAIVVTKASKLLSMKDLLERARARPGSLNYSSAGAGTATHLAAELIKLRAGIQMVHVPHSGAAPALQSLLTESVEVGSLSVSSVQGQIQAGVLIPLAVTGAERWPDLPDVPTLQESGVANAVAETWQGVLAPVGTPREVIDKVSAALIDILKRPAVQAQLMTAGYSATGAGPEAFARIIADEVPKWKEVIVQAGLKPQ
jgi:tripartite-type tricarboxylate transporter receptor subunit TctC